MRNQEWCGREDSNFHGLPHSDLNAARLPIPPRPLVTRKPTLASTSDCSKSVPVKQGRRCGFSPRRNLDRARRRLRLAARIAPPICALGPLRVCFCRDAFDAQPSTRLEGPATNPYEP